MTKSENTSVDGRELESLKVILGGQDIEWWAGNYGSQFKDMNLYLSPVGGALSLAGAHTETTSGSGF